MAVDAETISRLEALEARVERAEALSAQHGDRHGKGGFDPLLRAFTDFTAGVPTHRREYLALCWDTSNNELYVNEGGGTTWAKVDVTHSASASAHHTKYTDANAITAVEGEATLDLAGHVQHKLTIGADIGTPTIAAGEFTSTNLINLVATEASASSDDLDDVNGGVTGELLIIAPQTSDDVVLKHQAGETASELHLRDLGDVTLTGIVQTAGFYRTASSGWFELWRNVLASDTQAGDIEIATTAEINTGTINNRAMTPDFFAASDFGTRIPVVTCIGFTDNWTVADGHGRFPIPPELNNMDLVDVRVYAVTAGTTNTGDVTVDRLRGVTTVAMLSTPVTLNSGATFASDGTINTSNDDVNTDDVLLINVDAIHSTPAKGLIVTLVFRIP